jgi:hypothetical protein
MVTYHDGAGTCVLEVMTVWQNSFYYTDLICIGRITHFHAGYIFFFVSQYGIVAKILKMQ